MRMLHFFMIVWIGAAVLVAWVQAASKVDSPLVVTVNLKDNQQTYYVGQEVKVVANVTNGSTKPASVLRDIHMRKQPNVMWYIDIRPIPDQTGDMLISDGLGMWMGMWTPEDFIMLNPGESIIAPEAVFTPMFPGDASFMAFFDNGKVFGQMQLKLAAEPSKEVADQYGKLAREVLDGKLPREQRLTALAKIANDRHYFAAEQVRQILQKVSDPVIRDAATRQLIDLLKFGTAYRAWPDLIQILGRDDVPEATQRQLLNTISAIDLTMDPVAYRIGGQATYVMPTTTKQLLIQQLQQLSKGRNPYLASEANVILKKALKPQH